MASKKEIEREKIFNKCNGRCAFCGDPLEKGWHINAIIQPKTVVTTEGGLERINEEIENKLPSCSACSLSRIQLSYGKETMTIERFKKSLRMSFAFMKGHADYKKALRFGLITETEKPIVFYFETLEK